jgi:3-oxoacyl-[acyl-carrier protein] reductase
MPADLDLTGKVAIVTGASRGIGAAIARRLAEQGATVIAAARSMSGDTFADLGDRIVPMAGSLEESGFSKELVRAAFSRFKRLDVLVNNAGIMRPGVMGATAEADIEQVLRLNLESSLLLTEAAVRLMVRGGAGSIINMSSIIGRVGAPGQFAYAASKAGLIGATLAAAKELAPKGVRVNAIAPGFIATEMTDALSEEARMEAISHIGMARPGTPEDVADAVLFLASDLSRYVTGQVIGVDGGFVL